MINRNSQISRRGVLRDLGVSLSVPVFESLGADQALAELVQPQGAGQLAASPNRLVCLANHLGFYPGNFFPKGEGGIDYQLSPTLQPLEPHKKDFTVFSNLDDGLNGGHSGVHAFLSGIRTEEAAGFAAKNITMDQRAAEHVGSQTRYRSITAGIDKGTKLCWTRAGITTPPINNPARLFDALFVDGDESSKKIERRRLSLRSSVLDALNGSAKKLSNNLNQADKDKLDQYLTSVREVEQTLQMSQEWLGKPKPKVGMKPVEEAERMHLEIMPLMLRLMALALQTDSTRVGTFELPLGFATVELELGSYHGLSHHGKLPGRIDELYVVETYFMKQFSKFMELLKEMPVEGGGSVFDKTAIVIGSGMGNASNHHNRDLPVIVAGGGFKHKGHYIAPEEDHKRVPLSNLWLSLLQWFGVEDDSFGRSTGTFAGLG